MMRMVDGWPSFEPRAELSVRGSIFLAHAQARP